MKYAYIRVLSRLLHNRKMQGMIAWCVGLLGTGYFCFGILGWKLDYIPGDAGDARFINYIFEHGYQWICGNTNGFWNASFMYPFENTVAVSDNLLGTLPVYALYRSVGISVETSYQLWWITMCMLNFWSAYIVTRKLSGRWDVALVVAWVFAFSIFNMGQLNYMQMIVRFMVPVVIYAAIRIVETRRLKFLLLYCAGIVAQFYCVMYTGFFLFYFSLLFMLVYAICLGKPKFFLEFFKRGARMYTLAIVMISTGLVLFLMIPYFNMSRELGLRLFGEVKWNIPVWQGYFFAHESSLPWKFMGDAVRPDVQDWWLQYTFAGIIPLILLVAAPCWLIACRVRKARVQPLLMALIVVSCIILMLFVRTPGGYTLYALIFKLPGMNSMRVLNRFMHVELFFLLAILIFVLKERKPAWVWICLLVVMLDNAFIPDRVVRTAKDELVQRRTGLLERVKDKIQPGTKAFVYLHADKKACYTHLDAMMVSLELKIPTLNGYSSSCPDDFGAFFNTGSEEGLNAWIQSRSVDRKSILIIRR